MSRKKKEDQNSSDVSVVKTEIVDQDENKNKIIKRRDRQEFKSFDELVDHYLKEIASLCGKALKSYWQLGGQVWAITEQSAYGDNTIGHLSDRLGIGQTSLYDYKRIYEMYTEDVLDKFFVKPGVPYRTVRMLSSVKDPKLKEELEEAASKGAPFDDLKKIVDDISKKKLEDSSYERSQEDEKVEKNADSDEVEAARVIKGRAAKTTTLFNKACDALENTLEALQDMNLIGNQELYDQVLGALECEVSYVVTWQKALTKYEERINKILP